MQGIEPPHLFAIMDCCQYTVLSSVVEISECSEDSGDEGVAEGEDEGEEEVSTLMIDLM